MGHSLPIGNELSSVSIRGVTNRHSISVSILHFPMNGIWQVGNCIACLLLWFTFNCCPAVRFF